MLFRRRCSPKVCLSGILVTVFMLFVVGPMYELVDLAGERGRRAAAAPTTLIARAPASEVPEDPYAEYLYSAPLLPLIPDIDPWAQLANRHAGERCLLIGNGPSLNKMPDFSFVRGFNVVMGMNKITMGFRRFNFRPNYFATHNAKVIEQMQDSLGRLHPDIVKFIRSDRWEVGRDYNRKFNIVPTTSISVCGDGVCKFAVVSEKGGQRVVKYASEPDGKTCEEHCTNCFCRANERVVEGNTITYVSLQILFFMGCESVYLIGVDHNFQQSGRPNSAQLMEQDDPNHFDPGYFRGRMWDLADLESSERHYRIARRHYESNGRSIKDATVGGKLDIFEKASQEELYGLTVPPRSEANTPHMSCREMRARAHDFVDPWLSRAPRDPVYLDFAAHDAEVLDRLRQFNAVVCMQAKGWGLGAPRLSIVVVLSNSERFTNGLLDNIVSVRGFEESEVIVALLPGASFGDEAAVYERMRLHANIVLVKLDGDPGLYDTWNYAIRFVSRGKYITKWHPEDRKAPDSLHKRMEALNIHPRVDLVSAFVRVSKVANQKWQGSEGSTVLQFLHTLRATYGTGDMFRWVADAQCLAVLNPAHNSPMWRATLHARFGWFDMAMDPLSDWELWLRSLINKSSFMHLPEPLDLWYSPATTTARDDGSARAYSAALARFHSSLPRRISMVARHDCV